MGERGKMSKQGEVTTSRISQTKREKYKFKLTNR